MLKDRLIPYISIAFLLFLSACNSGRSETNTETDDATPYYKMNDLVLEGLKGNVSVVSDTMYDEVAYAKNEYDLSTATMILISTSQFDTNGILTLVNITRIFPEAEDTSRYVRKYYHSGDTVISASIYKGSDTVSIDHVFPSGSMSYRSVSRMVGKTTAITADIKLNKDYSQSSISSIVEYAGIIDSSSIVYEYNADTVYRKNAAANDALLSVKKYMKRDAAGNPILTIEEHKNDNNRATVSKTGYEYY